MGTTPLLTGQPPPFKGRTLILGTNQAPDSDPNRAKLNSGYNLNDAPPGPLEGDLTLEMPRGGCNESSQGGLEPRLLRLSDLLDRGKGHRNPLTGGLGAIGNLGGSLVSETLFESRDSIREELP